VWGSSPDPGNAGADAGDPATWNGYAYVGGNPVNVTDPDGLGFWSWLGKILLNVGLDYLTGGGWSLGNFLGGLGGNDVPWNEKVPGLGGGGTVNTGGVFGSGQVGPGVFSLDAVGASSVLTDIPSLNMLQIFGPTPGKGGGGPCSGTTPEKLDYSTPRFYASEFRTVSPKQHIMEGHSFPPTNPADIKKNTFYIMGNTLTGPRLDRAALWNMIVGVNAATFQHGKFTVQFNNAIRYEHTFPMFRMGDVVYKGFGMDAIYHAIFRTNVFVVEKNCTTPITSYPK